MKRAGLDYWDKLDITYYEDLEKFLTQIKTPCYFFTTKAARYYTEPKYPEETTLVFGREDQGLPETLLCQHPDTTVRLPMRDDLRSLNLSNAVAVGAYEVLRQWGFPGLSIQTRTGVTY